MYQRISEPVSVLLNYEAKGSFVIPQTVVWKNREYPIRHLGLHHVFREGKTLFHVFSVATESLFMRLVLNTDTLHWKLEEIADAGATMYRHAPA